MWPLSALDYFFFHHHGLNYGTPKHNGEVTSRAKSLRVSGSLSRGLMNWLVALLPKS